MYHGLAIGGVAAASLPFTGFPVLWLLLAAFAVIGAGLAVRRLAPRRSA